MVSGLRWSAAALALKARKNAYQPVPPAATGLPNVTWAR